MKYIARVKVELKTGHSDPEGETTKESLKELNYPVNSVKVGKVYEIHFEASSMEEAKRQVEEMCKRLLANPVKDDYIIHIEEV
ncbi:MAG: phosphoribosylformylglycinamidine synthase subunit PurS [Candidatus Bathyarchaeia archaeon]